MPRPDPENYCHQCRGVPPAPGKSSCEECLDRRREEARKQRRYRRHHRLCLTCGAAAAPDRVLCPKHAKYYSDRWRREHGLRGRLLAEVAIAAVAEHGSLNAAARALGVTWVTVKSAVDPEYHLELKAKNRESARARLRDPKNREKHNAIKRNRAKERYHTEPAYRARAVKSSRKHNRARLKDPDYRERQQEYHRQYYLRRRKKMHHYTIDTGHCRDSQRSEVSDEAIATVAPMLRAGEHPMPEPFDRYKLRVTVDGATLAATVFSGQAPLATTMVCLDAAGLAAALKATGAIPAVPLKPPAIVVQTYPAIALDRDAIMWLGDFERVLGWAWLEQQRG